MFVIAVAISYSIYYLTNVIQIQSFAQIIYTLTVQNEGAQVTPLSLIKGFIKHEWLALGVGLVFLICWIFYVKRENSSVKGKKIIARTAIVLICLSIVGEIFHFTDAMQVSAYYENISRTSTLYEDEYVVPDSSLITYPEKKKNIITIVLESMETTYADVETGGGYQENLISKLSDLAMTGEDFNSNPDTIRGAWVTNGSAWTAGALVSMTSGVPVNIANAGFQRNFDQGAQFMPNVVALGDLLEEQGYTNVFMCGSEAAFGGRQNYFEQHGSYIIKDYFQAKEDGLIAQDYREWWGFEDELLMEYARAELLELSEKDEPFNFLMLTADTHFEDGYLCPDCPDTYDTQYQNVIACSSSRVAQFIKWIQKQDFYKDTVILIVGDHLSMDAEVGETAPEFERQVFTAILNGPEITVTEDREYSTLDLFPTLLEAAGAEIEGGRLGLGVSLYSGKPTLVETYGLEELNRLLEQNSNYYNFELLAGDQTGNTLELEN
jgi:phosphoglycerol transferase